MDILNLMYVHLFSINNFYFRTFEALNGTCFLQKDWKYESLYVTSDKFSDVQDAVDRFKAKTFDEDKKVDSLFDLLDVSYRYLYF